MKKECYTTLDVYQASFLILAGFLPDLVRENHKIVFCFEPSTQLIHALSAYQAGEMVSANEFAHIVKILKSRVFAMKRECDGKSEGASIHGA